jgi:hypothetical protein
MKGTLVMVLHRARQGASNQECPRPPIESAAEEPVILHLASGRAVEYSEFLILNSELLAPCGRD